MARPRVFTVPDSEAGVYHVVSRVVDRWYVFENREKEAFVRMMRAVARFHQVEVLTFCVMGNHFHVLLRVPRRPEGFDLSLEEVMDLWEDAVGDAWHEGLTRQFAIYEKNGCESVIEKWRQRMLGRMFSLTAFMKTLKQRFTQWKK